MNAFKQHGIEHLSASSLNLFVSAPALWAMEKLLGKRGGVGPAAHRGSATEAGIEAALFDPEMPIEEAQRIAHEHFDRKMALSADPKREKEKAGIDGIVEQGIKELRQYGIPEKPESGRQHKISVSIGDIPVPFIGFLDLLFPQHNIIIDLKTSLQLPSKISEGHARQGAIYHAASGNAEIRFCYATPKKIGVYRLDDARQRLEEIKSIAKSMENFLSLSDDKEKLARSLAPDLSSFYYGDSATRSAVRDVWGF